MVDQSGSLLPWFLEVVAKQNEINGHTIMPTDLFKSDFTGDPRQCRRLSQCPAVPEQSGAAHRRAGLPGFANGLRG